MPAWLLAQDGAGSYMPHGMCYLWQPDLVWLHVASDGLTTLAYWSIPAFLVYFAVRARHEIPPSASYAERRLPYEWMFLAFGAFIVACGATHAMGIWTIWEPRYWLEGGVKAVTAVASLATAVALPPLVPRALDVIREARESEVRRVELEQAHQQKDDLLRRLRQANEAQSRFLANVSHDLRTPLSLVLGPTEELLDRDLPAEVERELETVLRNARTLSSQVENLLAVARSEDEPLEADLRRADLASTVREAAHHYEGHAHGRNIEFRVQAPERVPSRADPELVKRAVLNLLSNAFEFTPDGGSVSCALQRIDARTVEIVVADSGPGVPEDEREVVFDRFRQGEGSDARSDGGSGLGLAIVREVAGAHGGSVRVDDSAEGGARFVLRLPVAVSGEEAAESESGAGDAGGPREDDREVPAASSPLHPAREQREEGSSAGDEKDPAGDGSRRRPLVLLVEDDADMARHLGGVLSGEYRTAFAANGREGLEKAGELEPDIVVTDMMMPEMGGDELVGALRDRPGLSDIPVLVLTARAEEDLPERMLRRGAQDYVIKPVREGELRARIDNLLDLTSSRRLLQESLDSREESVGRLARMAARRKEQLEAALDEKQVLMRELHHRVKGNLQTITSLLQMQLRSVEDEGARRSLEESRGRVAAMGLLHEKLYGSGRPNRIELSGYLRSLVADVLRTRGAGSEVRTELTLENAEVGVDQAIACGLVVHELTTNALRHAFVGEPGGGTVRVELRRANGEMSLVVADDGRGLREDEVEARKSLGFQLVESLVEQLEGRMRVEGDGGTRVEIRFPAPPETGRPGASDSRDGGDR